MNIHEYQAKELFRSYGIPVPEGEVAFEVDRAVEIAKGLIDKLGDDTVVVKAQIHAGGRGKGGGVKVVKGVDGAKEAATAILGMNLVTHQTGPEGKEVARLLVEQGMGIARELYLGAVVDRDQRQICMMASTEGGMEIEEVAATAPDKILRASIDPKVGYSPYQGRALAYSLGLEGTAAKSARTAAINRGVRPRCCPASRRRRRRSAATGSCASRAR